MWYVIDFFSMCDAYKSSGLTWGDIHFKITLIHGVQDVTEVSFLLNKTTGVFCFVQTIEQKAGFDQTLPISSLHEGDIALRLFAAGDHTVSVFVQLRGRNERRSVFHRLVSIKNKILIALFKLG